MQKFSVLDKISRHRVLGTPQLIASTHRRVDDHRRRRDTLLMEYTTNFVYTAFFLSGASLYSFVEGNTPLAAASDVTVE